MKQATTVLIAAGALLVGGIATAAFMNSRDRQPEAAIEAPVQDPSLVQDDVAPGAGDELETAPALQYADIIKVEPVKQKEQRYATVIGTEPVRETQQTTVPREVCEDVVVEERLPEKDGNVGGTVAGAVIGGLLGNQVGGGKGRTLATVAGAVGGGYAGKKIEEHQQAKNTHTERRCHEVTD